MLYEARARLISPRMVGQKMLGCILEFACLRPAPPLFVRVPFRASTCALHTMASVDEIRARVGLEEFAVTNVSSSHEAKLMHSLPQLPPPSLPLVVFVSCMCRLTALISLETIRATTMHGTLKNSSR